MTRERLVIIGGDAAGMSAASQARRQRDDLEIVVFERTPHTSYSAWGIPFYVGRVVDNLEDLIVRTPEKFREKQAIDARTRCEAVEIDCSGGRVRVLALDTGKESWEPYDQLLIAAGAVPFCPDVPNSGAKGIFGVCSLQSGAAVRRALDETGPRRGVIVGGGYIGLEMAEALVRQGLEVSLIDRGVQVMASLDPDIAARITETLRQRGVTVYLQETVEEFQVSGGAVCGVKTDRRSIPADIVILGMGVAPNSTLAKDCGITLGVKGSIRVDGGMRTSIDGVWAAGDCAETFHLVGGFPVYIPLGTTANKQGRIAGVNISGGSAVFPGVVGTAVTKVCDLEVARTGLNEHEIWQAGLECVVATITTNTLPGYYPGSGPITVKLLAQKGTGRLLGGQIVGSRGSAKRIDVIATSLHAGFTADALIDLDLGYAPPFSLVWDPVQTAARELVKQV